MAAIGVVLPVVLGLVAEFALVVVRIVAPDRVLEHAKVRVWARAEEVAR